VQAVAVRAFGAVPELMELPKPVAGPGRILIRLAAAGVNPFDWKVADGVLQGARPHTFPLILGVDGAGSVEDCGPGVSRWKVGDRVYGQMIHDPVGEGTYAEYVSVPETAPLAEPPRTVGLLEAAAVPTAGLTALVLVDALNPRPGQTVLIVGASGGVGSFAVQLAVARGATVVATARPEAAARLRALGAHEVVEPAEVHSRVTESHPKGVDALVDVVDAGPAFERLTGLVHPDGWVLSTIGAASAEKVSAAGLHGGNLSVHPSSELQRRFTELIDEGAVTIPIESRIRLPAAPEAIAKSRAGKAQGKTVIDLA